MKKRLQLLVAIVICACFASDATSNAPTNQTSSATQPTSPQNLAGVQPKSACTAPRPKRHYPKKEQAAPNINPMLVVTCSPVVNIDATPNTPTTLTASASDTNRDAERKETPSKPTASTTSPSDTNRVGERSKSQESPSKTSSIAQSGTEDNKAPLSNGELSAFKFKIKDIIEADFTSNNKPLIWALLFVFVVFAGYILFLVKAPSSKTPFRPIVIAAGVVILLLITYLAIQQTSTREVPTRTIDRLQALLIENVSSPINQESNWLASYRETQNQLASLHEELRNQSRSINLQIAELEKHVSSNRWQAFDLSTIIAGVLLLSIGTAIGYLAFSFRASRTGQIKPLQNNEEPLQFSPQTDNSLPLNAIYRLEDLLGALRISTDSLTRALDGGKKPELDPDTFLKALNSLRRQLEGGLGIDEMLSCETPVPDVIYRLKKDDIHILYYDINDALANLDDVLSSRYDANLKKWRLDALKALAKARLSIISISEPVINSTITPDTP